MSAVHPVAGHSFPYRRSQTKSGCGQATCQGSQSPSWAASSMALARWQMLVSICHPALRFCLHEMLDAIHCGCLAGCLAAGCHVLDHSHRKRCPVYKEGLSAVSPVPCSSTMHEITLAPRAAADTRQRTDGACSSCMCSAPGHLKVTAKHYRIL